MGQPCRVEIKILLHIDNVIRLIYSVELEKLYFPIKNLIKRVLFFFVRWFETRLSKMRISAHDRWSDLFTLIHIFS